MVPVESHGGGRVGAQVFLHGTVKDLERLKSNAELMGELALFAYLLDMAPLEAREQQDSGQPAALRTLRQ